MFGYYALQVGAEHKQLLATNRMAHRWVGKCQIDDDTLGAREGMQESREWHQLVLDPQQLPFQANQLDLLIYPHTIEQSHNPRQVVREAERVLLPEGRLIVSGINPWNPLVGSVLARQKVSQWARRSMQHPCVPSYPIGTVRLCDWLELLGFEIDAVIFGGAQPCNLAKNTFLGYQANTTGKTIREGNPLARAYVIVATKKVPGMRLLATPWQTKKVMKSLVGQKIRNRNTLSKVREKDES